MTSKGSINANSRAKLMGSAAAICLAGSWSSGALAQTAAATDDAQTSQPDTKGGIQEIVVTAQRRQESTQDIPVAISALSEKSLENIGFQRPTDVAAIVPNVQVSEVYGRFQPIFSIRGISQSDYNSNQTSPVGIYADEAYIGSVFLHGLNFFDLERVEVLRGPQGTLYGKNTTGGAVNLISRTPKVDGPVSGDFKASYGNYKAVTLDGGIETPIIPGVLALRVAGTFADDEGYQRDVTNNRRLAETHFWGARATLAFEPAPEFTAILRYTHGETDQTATAPRNEGSVPIPGVGLVDFTFYRRPDSLGYFDREDNSSGPVTVNLDLVTLNATYRAAPFDVVSTTSYHVGEYTQQANTDGSNLELLEIKWGSRTEAFSQDLRLVTTGSGDFKLIIGGYYGWEKNENRNLFRVYGSPLTPIRFVSGPLADLLEQYGHLDQRQDIIRESYAAYSQARWEFADKWGLDLGVRYTSDLDRMPYLNLSRLDYNLQPIGTFIPGNISQPVFGVPIDNGFVPPMPGLPQGIYLNGPYTLASASPQRERNNRVTGKIGLDFKPNDDVMLYASYSRGYRSGNYNGGVYYLERTRETGSYASPEILDAYEVGVKSDLFDGKLRLNASAFQYDYTDQQFINVVFVSVFLENAGGSRIRGLELEAMAAPFEGLTLQASVNFLDTKYTELLLENTLTQELGDRIDLSGNELISAPKFSSTFSADYTRPVANSLDVNFHVDGSYRSRQWYSAYNGSSGYDRIQQKAYTLINGRVGVSSPDRGYSVALWAKNLLNTKYDSYAINLQAGFGYDYFLSGMPRTYGVEVGYKF